MDEKHADKLRELLDLEDFDDEVELENDDDSGVIVIKGMATKGNNPCGHERQKNCPMRCKVDNCSGNSYQHCTVNNCGGEARCNSVHSGCINRRR